MSARYKDVQIITHMAEVVSKRQSSVACEGEHLPGRCSNVADARAEVEQDDDTRHDGGAGMRLRSVVEGPNEREEVRWLQC